ncbi:prominin-1 [Trichonephila clavipes]|nr:prominin-1 [Trichonephila clavipes]
MKHNFKTIVFLLLLPLSFSAHPSKSSGAADVSTPPPTTPHPITVKLEQLQQLEESSLTGWYQMVNKFLELIKPDQRTLEDIINFATGKHGLNPQEFVLKVAKMNYAFLTMVIIGVIYVIVMLVTGVFFFCCRFCGRCGAKDSQKQRRSDNCWRTIHKFCLILMVAFLVVPITCMCIITQHMTDSIPSVKGNVTEVFEMLGTFANRTDNDIENAFDQVVENPIQNYDAFKSSFVELVQENISSTIDHEKLEDIKNIVSWIASVEEKHAAITNASDLSKAVQNLKSHIRSIRQEVKGLHNCTNSDKKICQLNFQQLPIERINVDDAYDHVHNEFQKLLKINFEELTSVIDQIQNNTVLRNKIELESESLKRFANETVSGDIEGLIRIKRQLKYYTAKMRNVSEVGKRKVKKVFAEADNYEIYRYYSMYGIAGILLVPVLFVTLGLVCGCSGYERERHPTKRSSTSNCGGLCLILGVYYFFLVSSALMVVTIGIFVIGGSMQTFACVPLYEENFTVLDEMKEKLASLTNNTLLEGIKPSQLLHECREHKSIIYAIGLINESDPASFEKIISNSEIMKSDSNNEIDQKLRTALLEITSNIRERLHQFTNALNLHELKEIPERLQDRLTVSRSNISRFIDDVTTALKEDLNKNDANILQIVNDSAAVLYDEMNALQEKLNRFSDTLLDIYNEADFYQDKIRDIEKSLDEVEDKLPKVIRAHLFHAVATSTGWKDMVQNIGRCFPVWIAFNIGRVAVCEFVVAPVNGYWFGLGWALLVIIPTIFFSVKLSRFYLRMRYDDDSYIPDSGEAIPLEDMSRAKPFSYTNPGAMSWMPQFGPHQNYMVHPSSNNQSRNFHYK